MKVCLTYEESKVVSDYLFRKACKLKEAGLEDSECYPLLMSAYHKIRPLTKELAAARIDALVEEAVKKSEFFLTRYNGVVKHRAEAIPDGICLTLTYEDGRERKECFAFRETEGKIVDDRGYVRELTSLRSFLEV